MNKHKIELEEWFHGGKNGMRWVAFQVLYDGEIIDNDELLQEMVKGIEKEAKRQQLREILSSLTYKQEIGDVVMGTIAISKELISDLNNNEKTASNQ